MADEPDAGPRGLSLGRIAMRIAQVAPLCELGPPLLSGGTQRVLSYVSEELVRLGHEVTLLA
jgi:hypothetical protein